MKHFEGNTHDGFSKLLSVNKYAKLLKMLTLIPFFCFLYLHIPLNHFKLLQTSETLDEQNDYIL